MSTPPSSELYRAQFLELLRHPAIASFIERAQSVDPGDNPFHDFFALNYTDQGIVSLKIYFSFYRFLERKEILSMLPDDEKFLKLYSLWEPTKKRSINHSGCSFAVKIKGPGDPTYQFHYRVPHGSYIQPPRNFSLAAGDLQFQPGVSSEYTGNSCLDKRYYYMKESPGVLEWNRLRGEAHRGQLFEYTETDNWSKIIHWFHNYELHQECVSNLSNMAMRNFLQGLSDEFGVSPVYPGIYEDRSQRSIYLFKLKYGGRDPFPHSLDGQDRTLESTLIPLL